MARRLGNAGRSPACLRAAVSTAGLVLGLGLAHVVRADPPEVAAASRVIEPISPPVDRAQLARLRGALRAFGVRDDDAALVQGDASATRCTPGVARGASAYRCEIAAASYALAAARAELGQAHALARAFGVSAVTVPASRVVELASERAPAALAELQRVEASAARAPDEPNARTWVRITRTLLATRLSAAATRSAVQARAALDRTRAAPASSPTASAADDSSLAEARELAARAAARAAADDDAYRARRGGRSGNRADGRREAAATLAISLQARITTIAGEDRAPLEAALAAARALVEVEPRLAALLDLEAELAARQRSAPASAPSHDRARGGLPH